MTDATATATSIAATAAAAPRPHAPYNRGNALVTTTAKVSLDEREALEAMATAGGKSVSAVVREAIQRHVRAGRSARGGASRTT
jgi:hypothetical protein